ncbi:MAG TPA: hypothetical protein VI685_26895 [Candidatus Angelobacter sp.]
MTCSLPANCVDSASAETAVPAPICPQTSATARRIADVCTVCGQRLAHRNCDACDRRICRTCVVTGTSLPLSCFCSSECRDEAELAAEDVRQTDAYARWG